MVGPRVPYSMANLRPLALYFFLRVPLLPISAPPSALLPSVSLQAREVESNPRKHNTINSTEDEQDDSIKDNPGDQQHSGERQHQILQRREPPTQRQARGNTG